MYTLTIIRLKTSTREFQNTVNHSVIPDAQTVLSILAGINSDTPFADIQYQLDLMLNRVNYSKTIELYNKALDRTWYCYISKV